MHEHRIPLTNGAREGLGWTIVDRQDHAYLSSCSWRITRAGYVEGKLGGRVVLMHRVVMDLERGDGLEVDHINRDKTDNRSANLRVVDHRQNGQNLPLFTTNTSGYRGVSWCRQRTKWRARVQMDGKGYHAGFYDSAAAAGEAAAALRKKLMPYAVD